MCSGLVGADSKRSAPCTTKHDSLIKPDPSACIYAADQTFIAEPSACIVTADETFFAEPSACIIAAESDQATFCLTADEAFFADQTTGPVAADETFCPDQTVFCRSTSCRSAHSVSSDQKTIATGRPVIAVASSFDLYRDSIRAAPFHFAGTPSVSGAGAFTVV